MVGLGFDVHDCLANLVRLLIIGCQAARITKGNEGVERVYGASYCNRINVVRRAAHIFNTLKDVLVARV